MVADEKQNQNEKRIPGLVRCSAALCPRDPAGGLLLSRARRPDAVVPGEHEEDPPPQLVDHLFGRSVLPTGSCQAEQLQTPQPTPF